MRLDEFLELDWVANLHEMFNTKIPVEQWKKEGNNLYGYLTIEDEQFRIEFEPFTYQEYQAINVAFSKIIKGQPTQNLSFTSKNASAIIGAIINAADTKLKEFQYDAIVFLASDNIEQRMRIYNIAAKQLHQLFVEMISNINLGEGRVATVLVGKEFPKNKLNDFKQHLTTLKK